MSKKMLLAFVASFVAMFLLAFAWHQPIMGWFYAANLGLVDATRSEPIVPMIAVGYAVLAFMMAYIYPKGVEGGTPMMEGFKFGAMIGLIWVIPYALVMYGVEMTHSIKFVVVDGLWHIVEQGIGGVIIAYMYGSSVTSSNQDTSATT